jgi:hypothetical protein
MGRKSGKSQYGKRFIFTCAAASICHSASIDCHPQIAQCRTRLAVQPKAGKAILFYSQNPDGSTDELSKHGACPVLAGDKWAGKFHTDVTAGVLTTNKNSSFMLLHSQPMGLEHTSSRF